jgi:hypothetical protein
MRVVVTGMVATYPVGGVAWDYGQYALGLERLGCEVYYLEDTGGLTYDPRIGSYCEDCSYAVDFLRESLARLSPKLADRWHFRAADDSTYGMSPEKLAKIVANADVFLNVSGGTVLRDGYMANRCKILVDSDPGWNHFVNYPKWDENPGWLGTHGFRGHDHFFTYAQRMGRPDCELPDLGINWHPTRPPVVVDCWEPAGEPNRWTTVMTWNNFGKPVEHQGRVYGTKEREFSKVELLPTRLRNVRFELAVGGAGAPANRWRDLGWNVVRSEDVSRTVDEYRDYVQSSRGEFSVAKNLYVATRSGWFSCRSVCYLAAGRPVVVQDTGYSELIPTGEGLCTFTDLDEAQAGIVKVEADYARHSSAAREIAREHFGSDRVLGAMFQHIGLN